MWRVDVRTLSAAAEPGRIAAVRLTGTRITGALDLAHGVIAVPVRLQRCELDDVIDLTGAKARDIDLSGSSLPGLTAPLAEVDGNLDLSGCECSGPVVLSGAHITGSLDVQDASLTCPGSVAFLGNRLKIDDDLVALRASVDGEFRLAGSRVGGSVLFAGAALRNEGGYALHGPDMSVGARFLARDGFYAHGEVRLVSLRVEGDLNFRNALLSNPGGIALLADGMQTGGSLGLSGGFRARGAVRLSRLRIDGGIFLERACLDNPAGDAIRCRNTRAHTLYLGADLEASGIMDFRNSQFANIRDEDAAWPQRLRLAGLGYGELVPPLSPALRVQWLRRDVDGYVPGNYGTLGRHVPQRRRRLQRPPGAAGPGARASDPPSLVREGLVVATGGHRRIRVPAAAGRRLAAGVPRGRHAGLRPAPPATAGRGSASRLQPVHLRAGPADPPRGPRAARAPTTRRDRSAGWPTCSSPSAGSSPPPSPAG